MKQKLVEREGQRQKHNYSQRLQQPFLSTADRIVENQQDMSITPSTTRSNQHTEHFSQFHQNNIQFQHSQNIHQHIHHLIHETNFNKFKRTQV